MHAITSHAHICSDFMARRRCLMSLHKPTQTSSFIRLYRHADASRARRSKGQQTIALVPEVSSSPGSSAGRCRVRCRAAQAPESSIPEIVPQQPETLVMTVGGKELKLESGEIGRQANGAVVATLGETVVYTTACAGGSSGDGSFLPLAVHYAERFSAGGRTSSGFVKRDGRPKDSETLISRLVDRSLRPSFAKGWARDTQVLQWVLSYDTQNQTEPLAITSASAALALSDIPLKRIVAGVRVGLLPDNSFVVNPTSLQMETSSLDLLIAGTESAVLMIEGFCDVLPEEQLLEAIRVGHEAIAEQCVAIEAWAARCGKQKRTDFEAPDHALDDRVEELVADEIRAAYRSCSSKKERAAIVAPLWEAARSTFIGMPCPVTAALTAANPTAANSNGAAEATVLTEELVNQSVKRVEANIMRRLVTEENFRADGRGTTEVRQIRSRTGLLPRTHGCALFTRGETQAIAVATLGSAKSAQKMDSATDEEENRRFYLQYFFPPSSVGETGRVGGAGRREIGHGSLAERALVPVMPSVDDFPYTVRVESTITESNGSSSMASVCGGTLAMLDAGVPLKEPVAGVAMGLILQDSGKFTILTDILGSEDALGDMDFKVAGTAEGVTAFQMDIKVEGITLQIMKQALEQAREGRRSILKSMEECDPYPRMELGPYTPRIAKVQVPVSKIGMVIGPGGRNIQELSARFDCEISFEKDGVAVVIASSADALSGACQAIRDTVAEIETGITYRNVRVAGIQAFGCFVEVLPGQEGLVHLSELDLTRTDDPFTIWKIGDKMDVMCLANDGKVKLSRKEVMLRDADPSSGNWEWPNGARSPKDLTPEQRQRGMRRRQRQPPPGTPGGDDSADEDGSNSSRNSDNRTVNGPNGRGGPKLRDSIKGSQGK